MKKTIYLLLFASLAIAGCVATREIPLTVNPEIYATGEQLDSLPVLPSDLSQIKYIHFPDSLMEKKDEFFGMHSLTHDYAESYDMVQLEGFPGVNDYEIYSMQIDDNLIFICYTINKEDSTKEHLQFPGINAIYTLDGKLVAQIGKPIVGHYEYDENGKLKSPMPVPSEEKRNDVQYFFDSRLQLNRQKKEVYFNEMAGKQVYFDYKGNYKRTEYSQILSWEMVSTRNQKVGIKIDYTTNMKTRPSAIILNKDNAPVATAFKDDERHYPLIYVQWQTIQQTNDDLMMAFKHSDTIWQILPEKKIARYVYTDALKVPEQVLSVPYSNALWDGHFDKGIVQANEDYVLTEIKLRNNGDYQYLYNTKSGQGIIWSYHATFWDNAYKKTASILQRYIDNITLGPDPMLISPDGTLICSSNKCTAAELKRKLSHALNGDESYGRVIDREEQFIRNLKLDGGPVLFFVKLKKF